MAQNSTEKNTFRERLISEKKDAEMQVVLCVYKNTDLYFDAGVDTDDFHNPIWKIYFAISKSLIDQGKKVLDDITVGLRVSSNKSLESLFNQYGGYNTIANGIGFVEEENFDAYLAELKKYNTLIRLHDFGFPIQQKYDEYKTMGIDDIQMTYEQTMADIFANSTIVEKVEDLKDGLQKVVDDADKGVFKGFPYDSKLLTNTFNGQTLGDITMISANSGIGKTALILSQILPKMIEENESLLIMANEEDSVKWKREVITWAANNVLGGNFQKARFKKGGFTKEEKELLVNAVKWLDENIEKKTINFVNFTSFSMNKAIRLIKKHSAPKGSKNTKGKIKYFVLDTLKLDADKVSADTQAWLQLQQNMVRLHDATKASNRNVSVVVTYQLGKSAIETRYLSQNSLGVSKNVVDVVANLMLVRRAFDFEKKGGKEELTILDNDGKKRMQEDKEYFIVFAGKNRDGDTTSQTVLECDLGRNIIKDYGWTKVKQELH
jgi:replicative DNA helicase